MDEQVKSYQESLERLKEIVKIIKNKDLDLEESLDLLEEGVNLANICINQVNVPDENFEEEQAIESFENEEDTNNESELPG